MHGLIFAALRGYLEDARGPDLAWEALGERVYVIHESHPDEFLMDSIGRACSLMEMKTEALLHDFGVFTGREFFPKLFPMVYASHSSARSFLPIIDERIHSIVRQTAPGALAPGLAVHDDGDWLIVAYSSGRKLCIYLAGLIQGTAGHFGEAATVDEQTCMHRGDPVCLLRVQLT